VSDSLLPPSYDRVLIDLKQRIQSTQLKAAVAINRELTLLYWYIGQQLSLRHQQERWGTKIIDRLAQDLKQEFPNINGFSSRNLRYMRAFAEAYPEEVMLQRSVATLPWRHNILLLEKLKDPEQRLWYADQSVQNGWSSDILALQIESNLMGRQGEATTNFDRILPAPQSDLARQLLKDPYHFPFLNLEKDAQERDLERGLVTHIREFLLELGVGFSFVGSQYPITIDGQEFKLDLLFYHLKLRCFIVIDLKMTPFEPEYSGKMNFYVSAVDELLKHPTDEPTIGIILCRSKSKAIAEFSLRGMTQPIGISTHRIGNPIPEALQGALPTPEQLEGEINAAIAALEKQQNSVDD
jgi:predicted nuclease of restriction endonuclease-like (RecB) superfamily